MFKNREKQQKSSKKCEKVVKNHQKGEIFMKSIKFALVIGVVIVGIVFFNEGFEIMKNIMLEVFIPRPL
ncbi:hypothetical protein PQE70_gp251 [Bacillus phage vB_BanS_Nate]|uniref:Uncharacterized protein n=1 Tax=Bacillus phage vB_BanS_Nate TaxID=2894788 RepID=A0AAE9CEM8_9CAUD|nr:hypothetical protein PQE70_gp251 [Bacillus phage vB_BanS_Nate]UGO51107.1 hypothetical protein NATE_273 [Bacillus phage vB_BanS_Nate]